MPCPGDRIEGAGGEPGADQPFQHGSVRHRRKPFAFQHGAAEEGGGLAGGGGEDHGSALGAGVLRLQDERRLPAVNPPAQEHGYAAGRQIAGGPSEFVDGGPGPFQRGEGLAPGAALGIVPVRGHVELDAGQGGAGNQRQAGERDREQEGIRGLHWPGFKGLSASSSWKNSSGISPVSVGGTSHVITPAWSLMCLV